MKAAWDELLRTRSDICVRLWDHIAHTPTTPLGGRYSPLRGDAGWEVVDGVRLRVWQREIDRRGRVHIAVGPDFVVVLRVSAGHPKRNE